MKTNLQQIEDLVTPVVEAMGYVVWHIELHRAQRKTLVRLYIDVSVDSEQKSVNIDDCSRISNQIGALFDVESPITGSYILEVSSPGLDRRLFRPEHYARYLGKMIQVVLYNPVALKREFRGVIQEVRDNELKLAVGEEIIAIDLDNVSRAKLILDF